MNPTITIRLGDAACGAAMRFDAACQRRVVEDAQGRSFHNDDSTYDTVYRDFLRKGLVRHDLHELNGALHTATLYRRQRGAYVLHFQSNNPDFPHERYDLSQGEAHAWCAECGDEDTPDDSTTAPACGAEAYADAAMRDVYSPRQVADRWGISTSSVRQFIVEGKLDAFRLPGGRLLRVRAETIRAHEMTRLSEVVTAETQAAEQAKRKVTTDILDGHRVRMSARNARQRRASNASAGSRGA